ncbi:MAG: dihydroorotate dehydrogenase [Deltaproteobacteria bacterium]|jgi:dihydroorotate dehydrogenase (NAD+) catalytic subunit|nr:dihydroorotate dehydrogenase [Deltaproteobacteria bacterium]
MSADLKVKLGPLTLKNPVIAASGVFGYGLELAAFCPPENLGAVILKGVGAEPWPGNSGPRLVEAAGGLVNAVGLENMGVESLIKKVLAPLKKRGGVIVGANLIGHSLEEYLAVAKKLAETEVDFFELNVSCPNLSQGGAAFGSDPELTARLTEKTVRLARGKPVVVKLPPLVTDITEVAKKVQEAGATAVSLINSLPALVIDAKTRRAALGNITGGLSGPPIKPLALRQVWLCARAVSIPVIGIGGIMTAADAAEFIIAGASAVQLGTAILADPRTPLAVIEELETYFKEENIHSVGDLKGTIKGPWE